MQNINGPIDGPAPQKCQPAGVANSSSASLKQALKADARHPKHERRTAKALYAEIKTAGLKPGKPKQILWTA